MPLFVGTPILLAFVLVNRSYNASFATAFGCKNTALLVILGAVGTVLAVVLLVRPVRTFLKFGELHGHDLLIALELLKPRANRLSKARSMS